MRVGWSARPHDPSEASPIRAGRCMLHTISRPAVCLVSHIALAPLRIGFLSCPCFVFLLQRRRLLIFSGFFSTNDHWIASYTIPLAGGVWATFRSSLTYLSVTCTYRGHGVWIHYRAMHTIILEHGRISDNTRHGYGRLHLPAFSWSFFFFNLLRFCPNGFITSHSLWACFDVLFLRSCYASHHDYLP